MSADATGLPSPGIGLALMAAAMLTIPLVDGLAKYLTGTHSPLYISWARYAIASLFVLPFALLRHGRRMLPSDNLGAQFLRTLFLVAAMTLYFIAISKTALATAITAYFIGPIVASLLAALCLDERIDRRKAAALVLGFSGAIIVLQPTGDIEPGVVYALASGICFAAYLVTTRQAAKNYDPLKTLAFQCIVGTLLLTPQAVWTWSTPLKSEIGLFFGIGILSVLSHLLSIEAFRHAQTSLLAPLVYLELVGTAAVGYYFFDEVPGLSLCIGAGVIVVAGLILVNHRSSRTA